MRHGAQVAPLRLLWDNPDSNGYQVSVLWSPGEAILGLSGIGNLQKGIVKKPANPKLFTVDFVGNVKIWQVEGGKRLEV